MATGQSTPGGGSRYPSEESGKNSNAISQRKHREKKKAYVRALEVQVKALRAEVARLKPPDHSGSSSPGHTSAMQHTPAHSSHSSAEPSTTSQSGRWTSDVEMMNDILQEENETLREMVQGLKSQLENKPKGLPSTYHAVASSSFRPTSNHPNQGYATQPSTPSGLPFYRPSRSDSDWSALQPREFQSTAPFTDGLMVNARHEAESSSIGRQRMAAAAACSLMSTSAASEATMRPVTMEEDEDPLAMLRSSLGIRQVQTPHQEYSFPPFHQSTQEQSGGPADILQLDPRNNLHRPGTTSSAFFESLSFSGMPDIEASREFAGTQRRPHVNLNMAVPTPPTRPFNHRPTPDFQLTQNLLSRWHEQQRGQRFQG